MVTVVGIDETSAQSLHGRHTYLDEQVRWGARHADMVSELPDGSLQIDMREFHRVPAHRDRRRRSRIRADARLSSPGMVRPVVPRVAAERHAKFCRT